jgi:hypothetical protein
VRIELIGVTKGRAERALPETTLSYATGFVTLAEAETEQRPTVLGLIASGRMRPDAGSLSLDDGSGAGSSRRDAAAIRRAVALVDAVGVSEPEADVTVGGVVAEELMFAGRAPTPFAARRWLDDLGLGGLASTPIGTVEPAHRLRILLELAALRPGVRGLVLTSPDRHGGEPQAWWALAAEFAERGFAVLVIAGRASRTALGALAEARRPPVSDPPAAVPEPGAGPLPGPGPVPEPSADTTAGIDPDTPHDEASARRVAQHPRRCVPDGTDAAPTGGGGGETPAGPGPAEPMGETEGADGAEEKGSGR